MKKLHLILSAILPSLIFIIQLLLRKTNNGEYVIKKYGIETTYDDLIGWIPFGVGIFIVYWLIYWIIIQIKKRVPSKILTKLKLITLLIVLILLLMELF
ncbi:MAG: hypothetical protein HN427_01300 [Flavobacteriales bacterium]|nr:hypothetical protein [Flavobacteriales bacterium]MBT6014286.1 hypothetical protein [Flavobacteriales bacterium]